ncbi:MAG: hypothetical protein WHT09_15570 [Thermogutta sp.]
MSNDLPQRFRNLAEQYQAVLEHWSVFWERVNTEERNRWAVWDAWQRFEKAFVGAASTLAGLKAAVPPEVANIWIGPTELVPVYCGYLRVGEALEAQAKFFHTWLPRVAGATNLHWIWDTDFYRYMDWFERDQGELRKAAEACEVWYRKQEAEAIAGLLKQPDGAAKVGEAAPAEPVITRQANPSATPEETAQTAVAGDVTAEPDASRIMLIYAPDKGTERMRQLADVINDSTLNLDNKLRKLNAILPIPITTSLRALAQALGVSASAIRKTPWWKEHRARRKEMEKEERRQRLADRREHYGFDG